MTILPGKGSRARARYSPSLATHGRYCPSGKWPSCSAGEGNSSSSSSRLARVKAIPAGACGWVRFIMVIQKMRQLTMQQTATRRTSRLAVRRRDSSTRQPDFRILWRLRFSSAAHTSGVFQSPRPGCRPADPSAISSRFGRGLGASPVLARR